MMEVFYIFLVTALVIANICTVVYFRRRIRRYRKQRKAAIVAVQNLTTYIHNLDGTDNGFADGLADNPDPHMGVAFFLLPHRLKLLHFLFSS